MAFKVGDVISFTYPINPKTRAHEPHPTILVLHPSWQGNMHGLKRTDPFFTYEKTEMIHMLMNPDYQAATKARFTRAFPQSAVEYDRLIRELGGAQFISPRDFYEKAIRPMIAPRRYQPYRQYKAGLMSNIRILDNFGLSMVGASAPPQQVAFPGSVKKEGIQEAEHPWHRYLRTVGLGRGPRFRGPPV